MFTLFFMYSYKFLDLKKVEFYQKLLYLAKNYETWLWKCCANRKCIIFCGITEEKSDFCIHDSTFQIAQQGFSLRELRWNLLFLNEIEMVLTKIRIIIIPTFWKQKYIANSFCVRKISNRPVVGRFEMVLSYFKFFLI